jgi:protein-tyrosine phosphatase
MFQEVIFMPADPQQDLSRLPLQTMFNIRDLGGMATLDGRATAYRRFIRSDAPTSLNQADLLYLLDYPVRTVIDLRCDSELNGWPNPLRDHSEVIDYYHIPILGDDLDVAMANVRPVESDGRRPELSDLYIMAMEQAKESIGQVFSILAREQAGAALFHCTLGKDRTGLVASLLLLLARVSEDDITDHYAVSSVYLKPLIDTFISQVPANQLQFFNTDPQNMIRTLAFFRQHYASPEAYLASCGLSAAEIDTLRRKLLQ